MHNNENLSLKQARSDIQFEHFLDFIKNMSKGMWTKHYTPEGKIFYFNAALNKSLWNPPLDAIIHEAPNLYKPEPQIVSEISVTQQKGEEEPGLVEESQSQSQSLIEDKASITTNSFDINAQRNNEM